MIERGDVVRLGKTAVEKHYVVNVWGDGTVQVRQDSTGKVRNVRANRCVLVSAVARRCRMCGTELTTGQERYCCRSCQVGGQNRDRARDKRIQRQAGGDAK